MRKLSGKTVILDLVEIQTLCAQCLKAIDAQHSELRQIELRSLVNRCITEKDLLSQLKAKLSTGNPARACDLVA